MYIISIYHLLMLSTYCHCSVNTLVLVNVLNFLASVIMMDFIDGLCGIIKSIAESLVLTNCRTVNYLPKLDLIQFVVIY